MEEYLKTKLKIILVILLSITLTIVSVSAFLTVRDNWMYPSHVKLGDLTVGSVPKAKMNGFIKEAYAQETLKLSILDEIIEIPISKIGISLDYKNTIEKIDSNLGVLENVILRGARELVTPVFEWEEIELSDGLESFVSEYNFPAVNAQIIYEDDTVKYILHDTGRFIDHTKLLEKVKNHLLIGELGPIKVEVEEIQPVITLEELQEIEKLSKANIKGEALLKDTSEFIIIHPSSIK
ncbi:MAG: hypothetical protein GX333_09970 [Syntrophomonadaceae bacterium]|nr:hypothetical protein [Syntrophomonadaceae bacterium]